MPRQTTALLALLALAVSPASAQALELGISDNQAPLEQRTQWATSINATWERLIVSVGEPDVAARIRATHAAGRNVILTVGGLGTSTRRPSFTRALRYIRTLPRADRYTIGNEPDLDGVRPCVYRNGWMKARRVLGHRLLWGDFSPHHPLQFTQRAANCGRLPKHLDMAIHPYQTADPLAPSPIATTDDREYSEGGIGRLKGAAGWLHRNAGVRVRWWITEFGYLAQRASENGITFAGVTDQRAAWLWPRALRQARRVRAKVLVIYTAQGPTWDTRPGLQAWAAIRSTA